MTKEGVIKIKESVSIQSGQDDAALAFQRNLNSIKYVIRGYNLISPMAHTSCLVWNPQTGKTQILNTILDQINVELTAVGKTKRTKTKPNQTEKSSQLTAEMIQGKFEKLA